MKVFCGIRHHTRRNSTFVKTLVMNYVLQFYRLSEEIIMPWSGIKVFSGMKAIKGSVFKSYGFCVETLSVCNTFTSWLPFASSHFSLTHFFLSSSNSFHCFSFARPLVLKTCEPRLITIHPPFSLIYFIHSFHEEVLARSLPRGPINVERAHKVTLYKHTHRSIISPSSYRCM